MRNSDGPDSTKDQNQMTKRIGIIGYGFIAQNLIDSVTTRLPSASIVFVHTRSPEKLQSLPADIRLHNIAEFSKFDPDLIIEAAHPDYTMNFGEQFLRIADYLPISTSALADSALYEQLVKAAADSGHSLLIPRGALPGLDDLIQWKDHWNEVEIIFRKPPASIDFSESGVDPESIRESTVLYQGPVRGIAALYPRNVNTMITCALATIGLDHCQARLVADPDLDFLEAEVMAKSPEGDSLKIVKRQLGSGVSGGEMAESIFRSVSKASQCHSTVEFI